MAALLQDLRYGARTLARSPGFTSAAVLVLALGIGANSAVFSVITGALLHAVPYRDPERIVTILEKNSKLGVTRIQPSTANFSDWKDQTRSLEQIAPWRFIYFNLSGAGEP